VGAYARLFTERFIERVGCFRDVAAAVLLRLLAAAAGFRLLVGGSSSRGTPDFNRAARSMIFASISPASPLLAGRCDFHTSG